MRNRATRRSMRADWPTSVRALCGKCHRVVFEMFGTVETLAAWSDGRISGGIIGYGRTYRWRCACGADFPVRGEKLEPAYLRVAGLTDRKARKVTLPFDLTPTT